jgi:NADH-quinone oxidoreductase subunit C
MSQAFIDALRARMPDAVASSHSHKGDDVVVVPREHLVSVMTLLKHDAEFDLKLLSQIAAIDLLTYKTERTGGGSIGSEEAPAYEAARPRAVEPRFYLAYNLYSVTKAKRLRVRVDVRSDDCKVPTITGVFQTANWWERYCWDMMGIAFEGHPNLKRLLLYPEFVGHPLRKDYPIQKRQPLVKEHEFPDLVRGPGPGPGGANVPMSQTHVGRKSLDGSAYD